MIARRTAGRAAPLAALIALAALPSATLAELLYAPEGNRLRVLDLADAGGEPSGTVLIPSAEDAPEHGRDINGMVCALPDGSGRFVAGEDTGQPEWSGGWGIFEPDGRQVGKLVPTSYARQPEPYGCAFDAEGRLFTVEIGDPGFGNDNGQLILWYPPYDHFPAPDRPWPNDATSRNYCKLATDLGTPGGIVVDRQGRVYVATSSGMEILRFSPPFPSAPDAAGGCGREDALGSPLADAVQRSVVSGPHWRKALVTWSGLALAPNGNLYAASVFTGRIAELDPGGRLVRMLLEPDDWLPLPPFETGTPQGLAVDADGALYYADLDLQWEGLDPRPGADGRIWRIRFDAAGDPLPPEVVRSGLRFPDGLGVLPGRLPRR